MPQTTLNRKPNQMYCILIHASDIITGFRGCGNIHDIKAVLEAGICTKADWFPLIICYQTYNSFEALF